MAAEESADYIHNAWRLFRRLKELNSMWIVGMQRGAFRRAAIRRSQKNVAAERIK